MKIVVDVIKLCYSYSYDVVTVQKYYLYGTSGMHLSAVCVRYGLIAIQLDLVQIVN